MGDYTPTTPDGHPRDEAVSALQKAIRRGEPREAIYWASQIEMMGQIYYLWQRLLIICHEDIGIAGVTILPFVETCRQHYFAFLEGDRATIVENMPLINAVVAMALAPKCRAAISYGILTYQTSETQGPDYFPVPDYAKDLHTKAGRQKGRGIDHFQAEGDHLENERADLDPYKDEAMQKGRASKNTEPYEKFIAAQIKIQKNKRTSGGKKQPTGDLFGMLADDDNDASPRGMGDYFNK